MVQEVPEAPGVGFDPICGHRTVDFELQLTVAFDEAMLHGLRANSSGDVQRRIMRMNGLGVVLVFLTQLHVKLAIGNLRGLTVFDPAAAGCSHNRNQEISQLFGSAGISRAGRHRDVPTARARKLRAAMAIGISWVQLRRLLKGDVVRAKLVDI